MKELHIAFVLHDGEFRQDLITGLHVRMNIDPDMKTPFTVHEACHPFRFKLHLQIPNVKSLRVPCASGPSLRIVPVSA